MDKNVNKGISTEFDSVGLCKTPYKTPPESTRGKPRFRVKSKMGKFLKNRSLLRTEHRRATYNMFFRTTFFQGILFFHISYS